MTKSELINAMADFPDDIPVTFEVNGHSHSEIQKVTEICPTQTDTSENYLLIS